MQDIAAATNRHEEFREIMAVIYKRVRLRLFPCAAARAHDQNAHVRS